ncbi:MAG TPA: PEP/pyruvate-binding domain-containing protein, partial [Solirubrobacterales bacterium]|nr:PEP/pyruvate-binding domain-containing protein [Solirubrobacterales bacterium]
MKLVLPSDEIGPGTPIGGKGRALSALTNAGLPVPPWAVVVPEAFYQSLDPPRCAALEKARDVDETRAIIEQVTPSGQVAEQLADAVARLCPHGEPVAVRSSASEEDTAALSFAG